MINGVFLLLGTNLGDRILNLETARYYIGTEIGEIVKESSIYITEPWGILDQPEFYNQVINIRSELDAFQMLVKINHIEQLMGRIRKLKWGERLIDIDILFYSNEIINTPNLKIPHPGIPERMFTLIPLAELDQHMVHPVSQLSISSLIEACPDTGKVSMLR